MKTFTDEDREQLRRSREYVINKARAEVNGNGHTSEPLSGILTAADLIAMDFPEPKWAVPGVIPDGATMLVGKPKQGKSWMMLGLGLSIAYGGRALGHIEVEQGEVLLLCLEDNWRRLKTRLLTILGGDAPPVGLHLMVEWPRMDQGGGDKLLEWAIAHPSARMIGIDVLTRMRAPATANSGDIFQRDYALMAAIKKIADETHIPIPVVHHSRKATADDPFDTISGTNGLAAAADTALILTRERGTGDANLYLRGRDVEESDYALKFDPVVCQWSVIADAVPGMTVERSEVRNILGLRGPLTPKEIADALGKSHEAIKKLTQRMFADNQIAGAHGKYMILPSGGVPGVPVSPKTPHPDKKGLHVVAPWENPPGTEGP